jgi:hypothetical protein
VICGLSCLGKRSAPPRPMSSHRPHSKGTEMTEQEWRESKNYQSLLKFLWGRTSDRKLHLFVCSSAKRLWGRHPVDAVERVIELVGRVADGHLTKGEALRVPEYKRWEEITHQELTQHRARGKEGELRRAVMLAVTLPYDAWRNAITTARNAIDTARMCGGLNERIAERDEQIKLIRDIFGNPFRPVTPDPAWQTPNAVTLAQTMYDTRDFTAMPLLADLLEEGGCPAAVSEHCRSPGPHVRGCWVVDLLLGKG